MVTITQTDQLSDTTALESSKDLRLFKSVDDKSRSVQAVADAGQKKERNNGLLSDGIHSRSVCSFFAIYLDWWGAIVSCSLLVYAIRVRIFSEVMTHFLIAGLVPYYNRGAKPNEFKGYEAG